MSGLSSFFLVFPSRVLFLIDLSLRAAAGVGYQLPLLTECLSTTALLAAGVWHSYHSVRMSTAKSPGLTDLVIVIKSLVE